MENNNFSEQHDLLHPQKRPLRPDILLTALVMLFAGLTGFLPPILQALCISASCALFLFTDGIYLVYAIMLFYENALGAVFGISIYRIYSLIFLVVTFLRCGTIKFQYRQLLVLCLLAIYCAAILATEDFSRAFFPVLDMLCIILLINCYLQDHENLRLFFTIYVLTAFIAYFTGAQTDAMVFRELIDGEYVDITRNTATFEDPNYMGFFYTIAIFATVSFKLFSKKLRILVVVALYAIIFTSVSITALLVNIVLWLLYLLLKKSLSVKSVVFILLGIAIILGLYQYGLHHPEDSTLGTVVMRLNQKLHLAESGDTNAASTFRIELYQEHWEYFTKQPFLKMLIGLNASSTLKLDLPGIDAAAHNEYLDWLLNIGVIGAVIMLYYLIRSTAGAVSAYLSDKSNDYYLGIILMKTIWILFALTLTLYGDHRFALFFLL